MSVEIYFAGGWLKDEPDHIGIAHFKVLLDFFSESFHLCKYTFGPINNATLYPDFVKILNGLVERGLQMNIMDCRYIGSVVIEDPKEGVALIRAVIDSTHIPKDYGLKIYEKEAAK